MAGRAYASMVDLYATAKVDSHSGMIRDRDRVVVDAQVTP